MDGFLPAITKRTHNMLLRRVIEHCNSQDWTAIGIDLVIVVVGIFIGIQVANWNDQRVRESQSERARERLVENIRFDIEVMAVRTRYFSEALEFGETALAFFNGKPFENDEARWKFALAAYQVAQIWPWTPAGQRLLHTGLSASARSRQ